MDLFKVYKKKKLIWIKFLFGNEILSTKEQTKILCVRFKGSDFLLAQLIYVDKSKEFNTVCKIEMRTRGGVGLFGYLVFVYTKCIK